MAGPTKADLEALVERLEERVGELEAERRELLVERDQLAERLEAAGERVLRVARRAAASLGGGPVTVRVKGDAPARPPAPRRPFGLRVRAKGGAPAKPLAPAKGFAGEDG